MKIMLRLGTAIALLCLLAGCQHQRQLKVVRLGDSESAFAKKADTSGVPVRELLIGAVVVRTLDPENSKEWVRGFSFPDGTQALIHFEKYKQDTEGKVCRIEVGAPGLHVESKEWLASSKCVGELNLSEFQRHKGE